MKKDVKKRKIKIKENSSKMFFLVWFLILFIVFIVFYNMQKNNGDVKTYLKGELSTLKWDADEGYISIDVLDYYGDDSNLAVTINWSSGKNVVIENISINISDSAGNKCVYFTNELPVFGVNRVYNISLSSVSPTDCMSSFMDVNGVVVYANINFLVQTKKLENITFYNGDSLVNVSDWDDYFYCLDSLSFIVSEVPSNSDIELITNTITHKINFTLVRDWYGIQRFDLSVSCSGDVLNVNTNGQNMSFYVIVKNESRPVENNAPDFLYKSQCYDLVFRENANYSLNLSDCFKDDDDDALMFRYVETNSTRNLTITKTGNRLKLTPDKDWIGSGYFYVYANDSKEETSQKIEFDVIPPANSSASLVLINNSLNSTSPAVFKIKNPEPSADNIFSEFGVNRNFSIDNQDYEEIKWYLDGNLVLQGSSFYEASNLSVGNHTLKVEIKNQTKIQSKTWDINVKDKEPEIKLDFAKIFLIIFLVVVFITIVVLIWMFIIYKMSLRNRGGIFTTKDSEINNQFNIPR